MRENTYTPTAIGVALLAFPILFIVVNVSIYELGINFYNPFDPLYTSLKANGLHALFDAALLLGPVIAIAIHVQPLARRIEFRADEATFAIVIPRKINRATLMLLAVSLSVLAIFAAYLVVENLGCLIEPTAVC